MQNFGSPLCILEEDPDTSQVLEVASTSLRRIMEQFGVARVYCHDKLVGREDLGRQGYPTQVKDKHKYHSKPLLTSQIISYNNILMNA